MEDEDLLRAIRSSLFEHVKSPSLTHIRDPHTISNLAQEIMRAVTGGNPVWRKWDPARETVLKSASDCWIPTEDMRNFLNQMPGPALTLTDVKQRLRAMQEEDYVSEPDEAQRTACLAIFEAEKQQGTELPAIIGAMGRVAATTQRGVRSQAASARGGAGRSGTAVPVRCGLQVDAGERIDGGLLPRQRAGLPVVPRWRQDVEARAYRLCR
jgi:hypothetical protein